MSAKEFVDAISDDSNLEAEDAFKSAISQKVGDALETKRQELAKGMVNKHIPEVEDNEEV
jgi:hypothetical protein|tara:strand:+ start:142 stop:321 length:180 start_codon:yes stop_codon:yes gene_type:complete